MYHCAITFFGTVSISENCTYFCHKFLIIMGNCLGAEKPIQRALPTIANRTEVGHRQEAYIDEQEAFMDEVMLEEDEVSST